MISKKPLFLMAALWELIRFLLILFAVFSGYLLFFQANKQGFYWLIILGVGHLLLPAILLLLYFDQPDINLIRLARLGKVLAIAASLLLIIFEPFGSPFLQLQVSPVKMTPTLLLLVITFIDLIFLFLLLSYRRSSEMEVESDHKSLPAAHKTEIPDSTKEE